MKTQNNFGKDRGNNNLAQWSLLKQNKEMKDFAGYQTAT